MGKVDLKKKYSKADHFNHFFYLCIPYILVTQNLNFMKKQTGVLKGSRGLQKSELKFSSEAVKLFAVSIAVFFTRKLLSSVFPV